MVAKISIGKSLYGVLAYNGEKINSEKGMLLATNRIYNDGTGKMDIRRSMEDFLACMSEHTRVEKPVLYISLNPHPDDVLTDTDLQDMAYDYLEKLGFGNQPYMVIKHEDIDRHHLHIVTVNMDDKGKRLNQDFLFRRSDRIRKELELKYGLHKAENKGLKQENKLQKVDFTAGDMKNQVGNVVRNLCRRYNFQTMGEYRALLSLYNITADETRGIASGREYKGLVYSATDDKGNKVGNPFKSSLFGKTVGYEAIEKRFTESKQRISERELAGITRRSILGARNDNSARNDKDKFMAALKAKGIDTVFRHTEDGRIYGATFIDHRTGCVLNGSRMGKELSANALQEHFTLPYAGQLPIAVSLPMDEKQETGIHIETPSESHSNGIGLLSSDSPVVDMEEEAFIRAMQNRKKKKRKGLRM